MSLAIVELTKKISCIIMKNRSYSEAVFAFAFADIEILIQKVFIEYIEKVIQNDSNLDKRQKEINLKLLENIKRIYSLYHKYYTQNRDNLLSVGTFAAAYDININSWYILISEYKKKYGSEKIHDVFNNLHIIMKDISYTLVFLFDNLIYSQSELSRSFLAESSYILEIYVKISPLGKVNWNKFYNYIRKYIIFYICLFPLDITNERRKHLLFVVYFYILSNIGSNKKEIFYSNEK
jgi:hypothetical protein